MLKPRPSNHPNRRTGSGARSHVAPRTPEEEMLAAIWSQLLSLPRVGVHDSFFALGAGGNRIWVAPSLDLVTVIRWMDTSKVDAFCARLMAAVKAQR